MATSASLQTDPLSSFSIALAAPDPERTADIEQKQRRVAEFLTAHGFDALLLQHPANFAWLTSGGDCSRGGSSETTAALFITPHARVVVCNNTDSGELFDRELPGLGFQLKERPWHEPRHAMLEDLCRGRKVASDSGFAASDDVSPRLTRMRVPLSPLERMRMRGLGRMVAHAVEATARHCLPGQTEAQIAGEVAHRLIKRQIIPERVQVAADGRAARYRHWSRAADPLQHYCTISAVGRSHGLHVGVTRTVSFGDPPPEVHKLYLRTTLVHAAGMQFSQAQWNLADVWQRVYRIYEKFGHPNEWQSASQADVIGYLPCETTLLPRSSFRLLPGTAVFWHPSIGPAAAGDTVLVGEQGGELLTPADHWPRLTVEVKGTRIACPDILRRPAGLHPQEERPDSNGPDSVLSINFEESADGISVLE